MVASRLEAEIGSVLRRWRGAEGPRLRLSFVPGEQRVLLAQANFRYRGTPVRVQLSGPAGFVATAAAERLDRSVDRLTRAAGFRLWPDPARPPLASVTGRRVIVRRKECALRMCAPMEAARVMDAMDYDAHLFVDAETGEDAVVYWAGPLGVRLVRQGLVRPPIPLEGGPLTLHPGPAPWLTDTEAADRLCRYGLPFVFYTDPRGRRGRLLLRRYDGDLSVVRPAGATRGAL
ncbi:sigma 54 modulation/S30EA ribosomal C-terminal domain-containing protein [Nocardia blacklockiae]|uniref:sigma 54 modulation/S30EA ribosomal C-terminal domain-containing protein n=1 Tax=Nocardia blacklockiae TaxID=480036 RepID=UPI002B4AFBAC|nr:sigma 54 modulation/S30EA ribosomal C-terminal domain-containing protein [Nocardia blacklockiae]